MLGEYSNSPNISRVSCHTTNSRDSFSDLNIEFKIVQHRNLKRLIFNKNYMLYNALGACMKSEENRCICSDVFGWNLTKLSKTN